MVRTSLLTGAIDSFGGRLLRVLEEGGRSIRRPVRRIVPRARCAPVAGLAAALASVVIVMPIQARQGTPVRTVEAVNLDRYVGEWFEIARFPNRFQKQCVSDTTARYIRRTDGRIDVINRCQTADGITEARGVARVVDPRTFAKLKVRFAPALLSWLPQVWGDYWILGLSGDYTWAVVGSPDRQYLWVLARTPRLADVEYEAALRAAKDNGFDVARLVKTTQKGSGL
jgi:apolipoprotein D and lipocalin family protein